ncbi:hypothetical protein HCH_05057 [Hahella chejuensis KCTC 2396]|uniref:Uncharacterized protein n=1 Tax=Hahella chejuensis (strain KCTC 2396) TaxID=349521 RepID=Q2SC84_HAHCH|nr:hypothetical protein [Hahella chejuensis]ABC31740.1 hypothetical protein HCH_05057 [Hahella chejuensis KCTC 2396]
MTQVKNRQLLAKTLYVNAGLSLLLAIDLILFPSWFAAKVGGLATEIYIGLGIALAMWAVDVFLVARSSAWQDKFSKWIVYLDWAWVLASALVVALFGGRFSEIGLFLIVAIALAVSVLALLEQSAIGKNETVGSVGV